MPTARPSITPSTGVTDTNSTIPENDSDASEATPTPSEGGDERQGRTEHGAEHDEEDDRGDDHTRDLTRPEDRGHRLGDLLRRVDVDALDAGVGGEVLDLGLGLEGDLVDRVVEDHVGHGGRPVLRHGAVAGRQLREGQAHLELGRLLVDLRALAVQLGLPVGELLLRGLQLRTYGGERAGLAGLLTLLGQRLPAGIDLRLGALELAHSLLELLLAVGHRPGRVVDLLLGRERVGHL